MAKRQWFKDWWLTDTCARTHTHTLRWAQPSPRWPATPEYVQVSKARRYHRHPSLFGDVRAKPASARRPAEAPCDPLIIPCQSRSLSELSCNNYEINLFFFLHTKHACTQIADTCVFIMVFISERATLMVPSWFFRIGEALLSSLVPRGEGPCYYYANRIWLRCPRDKTLFSQEECAATN